MRLTDLAKNTKLEGYGARSFDCHQMRRLLEGNRGPWHPEYILVLWQLLKWRNRDPWGEGIGQKKWNYKARNQPTYRYTCRYRYLHIVTYIDTYITIAKESDRWYRDLYKYIDQMTLRKLASNCLSTGLYNSSCFNIFH